MAGVGRSGFISPLVELLTTTAAERARLATAYAGLGATGGPRDPPPPPAVLAQAEADAALRQKSAALHPAMDAQPALVLVAHRAHGRPLPRHPLAPAALRRPPRRAVQIRGGAAYRG